MVTLNLYKNLILLPDLTMKREPLDNIRNAGVNFMNNTLSQWQPVINGKSYVYSVFIIQSGKQYIMKIIGFASSESKPKYCQLWYNGKDAPVLSKISINIVPGPSGKRYYHSVVYFSVSLIEPELQLS